MSAKKKLFLIYLLVLIAGFIAGWFLVSFDEYLKKAQSSPSPTFWQILRP